MRTRNWRGPTDSLYTANLGHDHWAWLLLQCNPHYHTDQFWFSPTWQALEAKYGRPPECDFQRCQHGARLPL